jgi:hypothetical protein
LKNLKSIITNKNKGMYTVDYFINKFAAIPAHQWYIGGFVGMNGDIHARCANGHCGIDDASDGTEESEALKSLFRLLDLTTSYKSAPLIINNIINETRRFWSYKAACVNDGITREYQQQNPKQRILAALYDIKKMQQVDISDPPVTAEELVEQLSEKELTTV